MTRYWAKKRKQLTKRRGGQRGIKKQVLEILFSGVGDVQGREITDVFAKQTYQKQGWLLEKLWSSPQYYSVKY